MTKLNQIIAVVPGKKTQTHEANSALYKKIQQNTLFGGISKQYTPLDEEGTEYPPEHKNVQFNTNEAFKLLQQNMTELFDVVATQEYGNTEAKADVVILDADGNPVETVLTQVPVTYLLFLEKQLVDIKTFVSHLPTLDPAENWEFDANIPGYKSDGIKTNKTKKVMRNHVRAEATDKHPAQVDVYTEDVKEGEWLTYKFSGAMPESNKRAVVNRVQNLIDAVKKARESANSVEVKQQKVASSIFKYIAG